MLVNSNNPKECSVITDLVGNQRCPGHSQYHVIFQPYRGVGHTYLCRQHLADHSKDSDIVFKLS